MSKEAFIRARTDTELKSRVEAILTKLGLNMTDAINLFFYQVELHNGLPFEVKIPNQQTLQSLKDLEEGRSITHTSLADFKKSLEP
jgi:DNA-damage-inducible protein J